MATLASDPLIQVLLLVVLVVLFLQCVNYCVAVAVDADRRAIAENLRMFAESARMEHFELLPDHIDGLADNIEGGVE